MSTGGSEEAPALSDALVPDIAYLDHRRIFGGGLESTAKAEFTTEGLSQDLSIN
jgi:hypothetical protein